MPRWAIMLDRPSGQVFREWKEPARQFAFDYDGGPTWHHERPLPPRPQRGLRGPRSLVDMAITSVVNHMMDVPEGYLDLIPVSLLRRVWHTIKTRGVALHDWKMLSKLLLDEIGDNEIDLYRFRKHISYPDMELQCYTQPMSSASLDFITHLFISGGCDFATNEVLHLAEMPNLGVLELIQPEDISTCKFPSLSDRVIRGWAEVKDCFPVLRVLRIWGEQDVTQKSLRWVSSFPSLMLYDVAGLPDNWPRADRTAASYGWVTDEWASILYDSLPRYILNFSPPDLNSRPRQVVETAETELYSILCDSRWPIRFVPDGEAPSLLTYATDVDGANTTKKKMIPGAKAPSQSAASEGWALWLFALTGQLSKDKDIKSRNCQSSMQAVMGPCVLPSKPFASLWLGHTRGRRFDLPRYWNAGHYTFIRRAIGGSGRSEHTVAEGKETESAAKAKRRTRSQAQLSGRTTPQLRRSKRLRMNDMLKSTLGS